MVFSLLICLSTCPLLQGKVNAFLVASKSLNNPRAKLISSGTPHFTASMIHFFKQWPSFFSIIFLNSLASEQAILTSGHRVHRRLSSFCSLEDKSSTFLNNSNRIFEGRKKIHMGFDSLGSMRPS